MVFTIHSQFKGTTTNIFQMFFLAYNIDVAASHRFVTVDLSPFFQDHSTLKTGNSKLIQLFRMCSVQKKPF